MKRKQLGAQEKEQRKKLIAGIIIGAIITWIIVGNIMDRQSYNYVNRKQNQIRSNVAEVCDSAHYGQPVYLPGDERIPPETVYFTMEDCRKIEEQFECNFYLTNKEQELGTVICEFDKP